jgi:plastocyanin|tara:strand:+ start:52 stop:1341 length:1290 start_codon:yes stop_codon:yes gene_type:complete
MATINLSSNNDVIIPTNDNTDYRGLAGDDTYILISQKSSTSVSIIDTEGNNVIQLPEWSKIKSIVAAKTALKITCDDMTVFTINGADKFSYDIGGNLTSNSLGNIKTFTEFVNIFNLTPPSSGTVNASTNKIVFDDAFRTLYEVTVKKEDNGNKYYLNNELSPDLALSSGEKYVFDLNDATASNHPLSISETKNGTHNEGVSISEGINYFIKGYSKTEQEFSSSFSSDNSLENAFVVFEPSSDDTVLYYYCLFHSGMANDAKILIDNYVEKIPEIVATSIAVQSVGASDYSFTTQGLQANDPILTLERGKTYEFEVSAQGHPFWIKTDQISGSSSQYNDGITNNGLSNGKLIFTVPSDAPSTLYYICQIHSNMTGVINIVDNNNGTIIETSSSNSDSSSASPPSYGYSLDIELAFSNDQDFIPTSGYDI